MHHLFKKIYFHTFVLMNVDIFLINRFVIFLHLLGLDTNGHAYGPHSKEYMHNIKVVDDGIRKVVKLIEEYYRHDGKTAYVFTADHGMSNRGGLLTD